MDKFVVVDWQNCLQLSEELELFISFSLPVCTNILLLIILSLYDSKPELSFASFIFVPMPRILLY